MSGTTSLFPEELEVIRQCLQATVEGPFFPDWEFHTLFGLERHEVADVLRAWPDTQGGDVQNLAVNNSLNNLLGYPHKQGEAWAEYISASRAEVAEILRKWRGEERFDPSGKGHFDRLA